MEGFLLFIITVVMPEVLNENQSSALLDALHRERPGTNCKI